MADYCRTFAAAGYACFSIDYRLIHEVPGLVRPLDDKRIVPKAVNMAPQNIERIEEVRRLMGLAPFDETTLTHYWHTTFAAADDMAMAASFVRTRAAEYGVDGERLALGGFSAGSITALNTAYGIGVPVKAVFALSGAVGGYNPSQTVQAGMPPALFFVGQNDLEGIQSGTRFVVKALTDKGIAAETAWVPGFGHFYPMGAVSLGSNISRMPVETRILAFLEAKLGNKPRE